MPNSFLLTGSPVQIGISATCKAFLLLALGLSCAVPVSAQETNPTDQPAPFYFTFNDLSESELIIGEMEVENKGTAGGKGILRTFNEGEITTVPGPGPEGSATRGVRLSGKETGGGHFSFLLPKLDQDVTLSFFFRIPNPENHRTFSTLVHGFDSVDIQARSTSDGTEQPALWVRVMGRSNAIPLDELGDGWHHLAITYERNGGTGDSGLCSLFLDGFETGITLGTHATNADFQPLEEGAEIFFGGRSTNSHFFEADIAEVMVFDRVLNGLEIGDLSELTP